MQQFNIPYYKTFVMLANCINNISQFINNAKNDINNSEEFNKELMEYLVWYNTEKPHSSINNLTPIDYLIYSNKLNAFKSNMLRYSTSS